MAVELGTLDTVPSSERKPARGIAPGVHVEGWRGPNGEMVVVPIGRNGRIAVPAPIYVSTAKDLLAVREAFDRGALPGQHDFPPFTDVAET